MSSHRTDPSPTEQRAPIATQQRAVRAVLRLSRHLSHALAEVGLSAAQYRVLAFLAEGDAMASEMAGRMAVSKPSVTTLVDGLVDRDLVVRRPDVADRRRRTLCITAAGLDALRLADEVTGRHLQTIAELCDGEPDAAVEHLAEWDVAVRRHRDNRLQTGRRP